MSSAGYELPLLLFAGFRSIIDELHAELARRGHQDMRPAHGFAMQAIGFSGATATEVGRRLGISKQAAGKTVERLEALGYVERAGDGRGPPPEAGPPHPARDRGADPVGRDLQRHPRPLGADPRPRTGR